MKSLRAQASARNRNNLKKQRERLTPQTNIVEDLGADSLDVVEFTASIEDEFGIMIVDESVRQMYTIGELTNFVEKIVTA